MNIKNLFTAFVFVLAISTIIKPATETSDSDMTTMGDLLPEFLAKDLEFEPGCTVPKEEDVGRIVERELMTDWKLYQSLVHVVAKNPPTLAAEEEPVPPPEPITNKSFVQRLKSTLRESGLEQFFRDMEDAPAHLPKLSFDASNKERIDLANGRCKMLASQEDGTPDQETIRSLKEIYSEAKKKGLMSNIQPILIFLSLSQTGTFPVRILDTQTQTRNPWRR